MYVHVTPPLAFRYSVEVSQTLDLRNYTDISFLKAMQHLCKLD